MKQEYHEIRRRPEAGLSWAACVESDEVEFPWRQRQVNHGRADRFSPSSLGLRITQLP